MSKTYGELMEANVMLTNEIISSGGRPPKVKLRSGNRVPLTLADYQQIFNVLTETLAALKE